MSLQDSIGDSPADVGVILIAAFVYSCTFVGKASRQEYTSGFLNPTPARHLARSPGVGKGLPGKT